MKPSKAPKKLYISDSELNDAEHCIIWFKSQQNNNDIEYVRTDAFIEKATLWLLTNASDYVVLHNSYDAKELVKDFIYAMKRD